MENPLKALKRAPRWAWIVAGGVGIGAGALKLYNDRADADTGEYVGEGEGVGGEVGTVPTPTGGGGLGIVVPPVINQADPDATVPGIDLITGVVNDLSAGWEALLGPIIANQAGINDVVVDALANAGGPPGQTLNNPTVITGTVTVKPAAGPGTPAGSKPCTWKGLTLAQWRDKSKLVKGKRRYAWPSAPNKYVHTRPFAGMSSPDRKPCRK